MSTPLETVTIVLNGEVLVPKKEFAKAIGNYRILPVVAG